MIDAFGPVGADGLYAESLRTAMTVLRDNRDTLLSVLEPFVKDPVIDWKKSSRSQDSSNQESVRDTAQARRSIKVIDERLKGVYNLRNPNFKRVVRTDQADVDPDDDVSQIIPLSVEGQVQKMISEATSHENLVQLYLGWMSWI
jgi:serine/threonine-protein kinase ATR